MNKIPLPDWAIVLLVSLVVALLIVIAFLVITLIKRRPGSQEEPALSPTGATVSSPTDEATSSPMDDASPSPTDDATPSPGSSPAEAISPAGIYVSNSKPFMFPISKQFYID